MFYGAAGLTYGSDNVMQIYVPELFDPAGSGPARSWSEDIHLPGAGQMQFVKKVLTDRKSYPNLVPDQTLITSAKGLNDSHVAALRDEAGSETVLVYSPKGKNFTLDLERFITGSSLTPITSSWYNPVDGTYDVFDASMALENPTEALFQPPTGQDHLDWVLVLER